MVGRPIGTCVATQQDAGFLTRCTETANSTFTLVSHRLLHLFQFHGVPKPHALTCLWPEYVAKHASGQTCPSKIARRRMQLLWAAWRVCVDANSALCDTDYPQAIGYFLDVHVALVTSGAGKSMASVMQHKLAPEQSAATFTISNEMHSVVSMLWHNANASNLPIVKLLQKGLPRPRSVRYIRPQVIRCASCSRSKQIARELIIGFWAGTRTAKRLLALSGGLKPGANRLTSCPACC